MNQNREIDEYHFLHNQLKWVKCEECGCNVKCGRSANAHILPKTIFKNVATNIHNHMYLCLRCHSNFDKSWEDAQKMSVFSLAIKRYNKFKNDILEDHRQELNYFEYNKNKNDRKSKD